eukprot:TRINITY_DN8037_c0_g1_i2.p1 TRINITY_DN8037_c0_g1~~TRINITY_DN8037_c0_g1_i2.p1  ORF type:complete len:524 (+),score=57.62 TRINITY_DN8037_c0_g1_i2:77-1648(+)
MTSWVRHEAAGTHLRLCDIRDGADNATGIKADVELRDEKTNVEVGAEAKTDVEVGVGADVEASTTPLLKGPRAPSSEDLMSDARREIFTAFAVMALTLGTGRFASCADGYPTWGYGIAVSWILHGAWQSWRRLQRMRLSPEWADKYDQSVASRNVFSNILIVNFVWASMDRADAFTDVTSVIQQYMCDEHVQEGWIASWSKSWLFSPIAPVMGALHLWGAQVVVLLLAFCVQAFVVHHGQKDPRLSEITARTGWCVDQLGFIRSSLMPGFLVGGAGGSEQPPFTLNEGEYVVEVFGIDNGEMCYTASFVTNTGRCSQEYGGFDIDPRIRSETIERNQKALGGDLQEYVFSAPQGEAIVGVTRLPVHCGKITDIITGPVGQEGLTSTSEAAALDLAGMHAEANMLCDTNPSERNERILQVCFARILMETALQICLTASAFELSFSQMDRPARLKQTFAILLSLCAALPKMKDLTEISVPAKGNLVRVPICIGLVASIGWASAKVWMAYACPHHVWGITSGCIEM